MRKKLTILTEPVNLVYNTRNILYRALGKRGEYGGHPARTKRIVEGIYKLGYTDFNYQPKKICDIGEHVHVMCNVKTLRFALELRKKGIINKLTAGPNIVVFADEYDSIIADPAIDLYLQPSQWAADLHMQIEPRLVGRCEAFPLGGVGIDLNQYCPKEYDRTKQVLIYHKDESMQFIYRIRNLLSKYGYETQILECGSYKLEDYMDLANKSEFMVVVGRQEASGNFLTEAWAMDTPTICFDPHFYHWDAPYVFEVDGNISTCPFLTEFTGARFYEMHELESILQNIDEYKKKFAPRKWVAENMTDKRLSQLFLEKIGIKI